MAEPRAAAAARSSWSTRSLRGACRRAGGTRRPGSSTRPGAAVACDKDDTHKQTFSEGMMRILRAGGVQVGRYIASGQAGANSDVIVWDFDEVGPVPLRGA